MSSRLQEPGYKNWIKCTLGLIETKDALLIPVKGRFENYYDKLTKEFCAAKVPSECSTVKWVPRRNKKDKRKWEIETCCQTHHSIFEDVLTQFVDPGSEKIYWSNSETFLNISIISSWEIAKVFMPFGNKKSTLPEDVDPSAIFTNINICNLFPKSNKEHTDLDELMKGRNKLMHSSDNKVSDKEMEEYLDHMIDLLESDNFNAKCKHAANDIREIKDAKFVITFDLAQKAMNSQKTALSHDIEVKDAQGEDASELRNKLQQCNKEIHLGSGDAEKENEELKQKLEQMKHETDKSTILVDHLKQEKEALLLLKQDVQSMSCEQREMMKESRRKLEELDSLYMLEREENEKIKENAKILQRANEALQCENKRLVDHVKQEREGLVLMKQDVKSMAFIQKQHYFNVSCELNQLETRIKELKEREELEQERIMLRRMICQLKEDLLDAECFCLILVIVVTMGVSFLLRVYNQ